MVSLQAPPPVEVGQTIPANTAHAISVVLPTWAANVGYEEGQEWVVKAMRCGYPRFFIGLNIQKLAARSVAAFGQTHQAAMLFPSRLAAKRCRAFILDKAGHQEVVEIVDLHEVLQPGGRDLNAVLSIVLYDAQHAAIAKQYWQHAGEGISSRFADYFLEQFDARDSRRQVKDAALQTTNGNHDDNAANDQPSNGNLDADSASVDVTFTKPNQNNRYYSRRTPSTIIEKPASSHDSAKSGDAETLNRDQLIYLEERYGRCLSLDAAMLAKRAVRRRIAGSLTAAAMEDLASAAAIAESLDDSGVLSPRPADETEAEQVRDASARVDETDVYLYQCGMAAIFHAHRLAMLTLPKGARRKSVCFGFPYTDTLKILEKWGPGAHFYGRGDAADLAALTKLLEGGESILAVFCECPSNPLLRTPPLKELRRLADKYGFLIVVDETIGNFINVDVGPFTDIVVSSLTKIFSGDSNVMGGSLIVMPTSPFYSHLKCMLDGSPAPRGSHLAANDSSGSSHRQPEYEDNIWCEDAVTLERNSRDFVSRIMRVDASTEKLCDLLVDSPWVAELFYPKYGSTRAAYDDVKRTTPLELAPPHSTDRFEGGFGGLFSLTFASIPHAQVFFDNLHCAKGPSLGTNFTLASPYTLLAHYTELDWAASFGVPTALVRCSVGLEPFDKLWAMFERALDALDKQFGSPANLGL
ncbi:Cystathionine gamma-synthase [Savitreella phatthalungensis]